MGFEFETIPWPGSCGFITSTGTCAQCALQAALHLLHELLQHLSPLLSSWSSQGGNSMAARNVSCWASKP